VKEELRKVLIVIHSLPREQKEEDTNWLIKLGILRVVVGEVQGEGATG